LGLLPFSNCVHYDAEPARRAEYHRAVADGMRGGYAADDGVALHFRGTRLQRAVSSTPQAGAYRVAVSGGRIRETRLAVSYLGEGPASTAGPTEEVLPEPTPARARRPALVAA
jgi:hypothetical protein